MSVVKNSVEKQHHVKKRVPGVSDAASKRSAKLTETLLKKKHVVRPRKAHLTAFSRIVSGELLAGFAAVKSIREGYPAHILKSASSFFDVPDARIQSIAQVPATTASRLEKKQANIDPAATERIYRMGTVTRMAIDVFENQDAAIKWMCQPNRTLGGVAPLDLMDTEPGAVSVRQVLNAIETGGVA
ncbi:type II RES/Xre toxin-antitoxin system antitoxin [Glaciimonas soli]|uniref:type II RES/Xre toxin-antitoxin system antitoxin n=1 Tax=Glaciimonas soli TaxID=2590999 RepID=UPI001293F294|nr:antitoxin Xre/MbcA/ParS toxin-binding domain-containing protein [Glaciimonas soli]